MIRGLAVGGLAVTTAFGVALVDAMQATGSDTYGLAEHISLVVAVAAALIALNVGLVKAFFGNFSKRQDEKAAALQLSIDEKAEALATTLDERVASINAQITQVNVGFERFIDQNAKDHAEYRDQDLKNAQAIARLEGRMNGGLADRK